MENTGGGLPFPTNFKTDKNPKSIHKLRQQFIDVDYPDGQYLVNFRYKLKAPGFKPTKYLTEEQKRLKLEYPNANYALGYCDIGHITIVRNM